MLSRKMLSARHRYGGQTIRGQPCSCAPSPDRYKRRQTQTVDTAIKLAAVPISQRAPRLVADIAKAQLATSKLAKLANQLNTTANVRT
jgi:hypothetical protein